jgi:hypothetical protein
MSTAIADPPRKPRRGWAAISLRGLLVLVLAVALRLGWADHRARQQREAVDAVRKFGGFVHYDWEFAVAPVRVPPGNFLWKSSWGTLTPGRKPPAPNWLRRAVGDEYFQDIAHVSLFVDIEKGIADSATYNIGPADNALAKLSTQTRVRTLHLGGQQVTDKNLAHVGRMTGLEELIIFPGLGLTDAGVAHLAELKNLRVLILTDSEMTDASLRHIGSLTQLQELSLEGKGFSDEGLAQLRGLTRLKSLRLDAKQQGITEDGKKRLRAPIPGLKIE